MTYFLNEAAQVPQSNILPPDISPTGFLEGVGAGFQKAALENDANFRVWRETLLVQGDMALRAGERLGRDRIASMVKDRNARAGGDAAQMVAPGSVEEMIRSMGPNGAEAVLEAARQEALADPAAWSDMDLTPDAVDKRVNERLRAEYSDLEQTLAAMPSRQWAANLIGGMAGMTVDVKNAPFLFLGGSGGSLLKVFGREALLNTAAEAVNMPTQYSMADRLEIPDPNPVLQLATAALAGGILGTAVEALPRALTYFRGRERVVTPPGVNPTAHAVAVEVAEDAIATGRNPLEAVQRVIDDLALEPMPVNDLAAAPPREPLVPRQQAEPPPVEPPSTPPAPEAAPPRDMTAMAEDQLSVAETLRQSAIGNRKYPLLTSLKRNGVRINPDSPEGQTLKAMGITNKTMPGLFSRKAAGERTALDTMVAQDWEERLPGIWDATNTPRGTDGAYLDLNGVFEVLRREQAGDLNWIRDVAEANDLERDAQRILNGDYDGPSELDDFKAAQPANDGLFFQPFDVFQERPPGPADVARVKREVGQYLFQRGIRDMPDDVLDEIAEELATYGGDAKFLIERALYRDIDGIASEILGGADGTARAVDGADGTGGRPDGSPQRDAGSQGATGGDQGQPASTERTAAGVQYVAPGIAPVTDRARLEAAQSRPLTGGNVPMDVGLFDTGARAQMDLFSDPTGPAAKAGQEVMLRDLQDSLDTDGDFMVDLGDGRGERTASALLRELDDDTAFNEILDACRAGRTE